MNLQTVSHVLKQNHLHSSHFVSTFSSLDAVLGGGIPCGFITQIAGMYNCAFDIIQFSYWAILTISITNSSTGIHSDVNVLFFAFF